VSGTPVVGVKSESPIVEDWITTTMNFQTVKNQKYKIKINLTTQSAIDAIRVVSSNGCESSIPNPYYQGGGNNPTPNPLVNLGEVNFTGGHLVLNPLETFDPNTTIYFPPTDPQIGAGPCCGPFSEETIPQLLTPTFPNGGASDFTMAYTPASSLDAQMAAYLNYVHSQDPSITTISINYSVASLGTGASAAAYGPFVTAAPNKTVTWTWTPTGVTNNATSFWSGTPFAIGTWYGVMTTISHNGSVSSPFFNANCIQNWWRFRAQGTMRLGKPTSNVVSFDTIDSANRVVSAPARPVLAGERLRVPAGETRGIQGR
jgi:hypothetical protein